MGNIRMNYSRGFALLAILSVFLLLPGQTDAQGDESGVVDEFSPEFIETRDFNVNFVTKESHRITREIDRWFLLTATGEDNNTLINPDEPKANWGAVMGFDEWLRLPDGERVVAIRHLAVYINTPADNAGLLFNDALYEIDGKRLAEDKGPGRNKFSQIIDEYKPGDKAIVKFVRGAKPETQQESDWYNGQPSQADLVGGEMMETEVTFDTQPVEDIPEGPYYWRTTKAFPMETTLSILLFEFDLWDDFTGLTRSMDKITRRDLNTVRIFDDRPAPFRLPIVTDILRHPSACANISRMMGDEVTKAVEGDEVWLSCGIPQALEYLGKFGNSKDDIAMGYHEFKLEVLGIIDKTEIRYGHDPYQYVLAIAWQADKLVTEATSHLSEDDRQFIIENALDMIRWEDDGSEDDPRDLSGSELREKRVEENDKRVKFFRLTDSIDLVKMGVAACLLTSLNNDDLREGLVAGANISPDVFASPLIRAGGIGDVMYYRSIGGNITLKHQPTIVIDLGNDITYRGTPGGTAPLHSGPWYDKAENRVEGEKNDAGFADEYQRRNISLILDFGGDDTYLADDISLGCGLLGVSVVIDFEGDDTYIGGIGSQGAGILGVGALIDLDGNDTYNADEFAQGASLFGIGLLLDESRADLDKEKQVEDETEDSETAPVIQKTFTNSDKYTLGVMGQGFGFPGGFGMLYDRHGSDIYIAGWRHGDYRRPGRGWDSMAQGFGWGMRPWSNDVGADGGIGLLIDRKGHDNYIGDHFCQGSSYWYALGVLIDDEGHDRYMCGTYSQGSGIHLSAGALLDGAGDDMYTCYNSLGQGNAHDWATGMLVDGGGNDRYFLNGGGQGGAVTVSFGMLIDFGGNDHYDGNDKYGIQASGDFHTGRAESSFGVLFDLGEGDDWYADERLTDGIIAHKRHHGLFLDDGIKDE